MSKVLFINQSSKKPYSEHHENQKLLNDNFVFWMDFLVLTPLEYGMNVCDWHVKTPSTHHQASALKIFPDICVHEFKPKELKEKVLITSIRACCIVMPAGENNGHVGHSGHAVLELPVAWYWKLDSSPSGRARPATVSWGIVKSQQVSNSSPWQVK